MRTKIVFCCAPWLLALGQSIQSMLYSSIWLTLAHFYAWWHIYLCYPSKHFIDYWCHLKECFPWEDHETKPKIIQIKNNTNKRHNTIELKASTRLPMVVVRQKVIMIFVVWKNKSMIDIWCIEHQVVCGRKNIYKTYRKKTCAIRSR